MARFVPDASVTLPWCFEDEASPRTDELLFSLRSGDEAFAPAHWSVEVLNGLLVAVRRGRISREKVGRFWGDLKELPLFVERPSLGLWPDIQHLAEQYRLTAYDAAYLELARRTRSPLATLDADLRRAAISAGVQVL